MRRIDAIAIAVGFFAAGGVIYLILQQVGLDDINAGIWSQVILVAVLVGWVMTYITRALTKNMTYNQQLKDYEDAVLQKRLEEMTPEELAKLQAEVEAEKAKPKGRMGDG
jgi:membrane protein implicated in regulation of membrane protease activity